MSEVFELLAKQRDDAAAWTNLDYLLAGAGTVSALAAAVAVYFAWRAASEARGLRREERLARLPELVVELVACATEAYRGLPHEFKLYPFRRRRLAAALELLDASPPACLELATGERFAELAPSDPIEKVDAFEATARDALIELRDLLGRVR